MSLSSSFTNISHTVNGLVLQLPMGHRLPAYQAKFMRYDRFLPFLVKQIPAGSGVLDIGANCGDTLAAIVPMGPGLRYHAVEPSSNYYRYLEQNLKTIHEFFPSTVISCSMDLIGVTQGQYTIVESQGTAAAVKLDKSHAAGTSQPNTLVKTSVNNLVKSLGVDFKLRLLKTDTDGADWEVINSALEVIEAAPPIIFFECDPKDDEGVVAYQSTFENLNKAGYEHYYIFDNYGAYMFQIKDATALRDLTYYFYKQVPRTIYYMDVVACTSNDAVLVEAAIKEFNETKF